MKKVLSAVLCLLVIASLTLSMGGCSLSDDNYPVTVGHTEIKEKPEALVVLSDNIADILSRLGYSTQIAGVSDACTQSTLTRYVDSVGDELNPSVDAIVKTGAKYVLADKELSEATLSALEENDIEVITMACPKNTDQLKALYEGLGKIAGGAQDGYNIGTAESSKVIAELEETENLVNSNTVYKLFCYLYLNEDKILCSYNANTQEGFLLEYLGATNVASNFSESRVDQSILKLSNPEYIFYDSKEVLDYINMSDTLKEISAMKKGNTFMISKDSLQRQGNTMLETQKVLLSKMYPDLIKAEVSGDSLASRYNIELTEDMVYEIGSDSEDVKIIQQRLIDLGYLQLDSGDSPTTYYGEKSAEAVKSFQTANGLEATGVCDYDTLNLLFMSSTLSTSGSPYIPGSSTESTTEAAKPAEGSITPQGYDITFDSSTVYKLEDDNEDIKVIQDKLNADGYLVFEDESDTPTTYYGEKTESAVKDFQQAKNLEVTGICDYETLKALFGVQ